MVKEEIAEHNRSYQQRLKSHSNNLPTKLLDTTDEQK